ncbi:MAG: M3 family oligoendopeptidase, partial [Lachnospiraceae bacterium]
VVLNSASSFLQPEILSLGVEWLEKALEENEGLKFYDRIIKEMIRHNAHTLSPEQETLLAEAAELGNSPSHIYGLFSNADMKFPFIKDEEGNEVELTHGNFVPFEESSDRRVRKDAYEALYGVYGQYKNSIAAMFQANIKKAMFFAKARKYSSTRAFYLDDSNIPEAVYDNLIDTVHKNLSKMHRYVTLRKKMLGVDQLHFYDVYTSLLSDFKKEFTYEQAKEMVNDGLKPMGEEYLQILNEGFNNGWVDVYENVGKRSGAYSFGSYESDPYVLTNFHGTLDNVFTLAHEMGHSIHSYYSRKNQSYAYSDYKIFVAEVASTCNEALLIHDLLKKTEDKKEKAYLLNHFMESFKSTLYRQAMFAEFEMICHRRAEANEV